MSTSISIEFEFDLCTIAKEQNVQVSTRSDRVIVPYNLFFIWLRRNFRKAVRTSEFRQHYDPNGL